MGKSWPFAALLVATTLEVAGCGGRSKEPPPVAALASTRQAQEAFRLIRQSWLDAGPTSRKTLEPKLRWFLSAFPNDGLVPLARTYLALSLLEAKDVPQARQILAPVLAGSAGATRDLAQIAEGAILLQQGQPSLAVERLLPLVGKVIDPYARILFDQEMVEATIGSGRWYEAVAYMDVWLRDAQDEDHAAVEKQVDRALAAVPAEALELMLRAMDRDRARAGYGSGLRSAVVARLTAVALQKQDAELARRLVQVAGPAPGTSDVAEGLEDLASSGAGAAVDGRTIGIIIATGSGVPAARAAEVLSGAIDALRSRPANTPDDAVRLLTREEREPTRTEQALVALASQGAAVLVAGLDATQAEAAERFADRTGTPTILLFPSRRGSPSAAVFTLGEPEGAEGPAVEAALRDRGARNIVTIGPGAVPCDIAPVQAGEARFPVRTWKQKRVDGLLLMGSSSCARDVIVEASAAGLTGLRFGVGLLGADVAAGPEQGPALLLAGAGAFPLLRGASGSPLEGYGKRHGSAPTWSASLGHDAAVLARSAVAQLPRDKTEDPKQVAQRHALAAAALGSAEAPLWTTEARAFGADRAMPRTVTVREHGP